jgi:hypothetical protein
MPLLSSSPLPRLLTTKRARLNGVDTMWTPSCIAIWPLKAAFMQYLDFIDKIGAGEGIRTLDPDLGKVVLYP